MADFRKWIYALVAVALLAGLTVPASAQSTPFACTIAQSVVPIVRAEGYTELTGDIVINCSGGVPTDPGRPVPQVNFTVFLNTNITSKITTNPLFNNPVNFNLNFNEALLLVDEPNGRDNDPNTPLVQSNPILNCGQTGAPDTGPSGPGVCNIVAPASATGGPDPAQTYNGTANVSTDPGSAADGTVPTNGTCGATVPNSNPTRIYGAGSEAYGCGRPNVFQGRVGTPQNPGQFNAVSFLGVPVDPPGTTTTRTFRITNIRANAVAIGVSAIFITSQIQANIAINGPTTMTISNPQQIVAYVNRGLTVELFRNRLDFIQCNSENPDLHRTTTTTQTLNFQIPSYLGNQGANFLGTPPVDATPMVRFIEGFASSWKTRNLAQTIGSGTTAGNATYVAANDVWVYGPIAGSQGPRNNPGDVSQNVPGAVFNTESGFMYPSTAPVPNPNPPPGFGFQQITTSPGAPFGNAYTNPFGGGTVGRTGFALAGTVNANTIGTSGGTRLSLAFSNVPSGASLWVAPFLYLYRQGSTYQFLVTPNPTTAVPANGLTGVAVLASGASSANGGGGVLQTGIGTALIQQNSIAVYEILYTDVFALELLDVPVVVAYVANPNQNLPTAGTVTQAAGGFAPFYTTSAAGQPAPLSNQNGFGLPTNGLPIPRFTPGTARLDLFLINKCACNLLFPYVVSAAGFDTGIAVANTSSDPGVQFGFSGVPQSGTVQFWYYGVMASGGAVPGPQTSKSVPNGQVLTYVASSGSTDWGLDGRAAGFIGYVIAQAQFQYCHAFAYISALGAGPLTPGMSVGYLGLVLDRASLERTNQLGENKAH